MAMMTDDTQLLGRILTKAQPRHACTFVTLELVYISRPMCDSKLVNPSDSDGFTHNIHICKYNNDWLVHYIF